MARALTGVGEASYTVVTPSLISDFYPADRRGRALAIFYAAIPIGSALGLRPGRRDQRALRLARGVLRRGRAGRGAGGASCSCSGIRRAARFDAVKRRARRGAVARHVRRRLRARPSFLYNTVGADHLHVRGRRPRVLDADLLRGACATCRSRSASTLTSAACWCWPGFAGTLIGGRGGDRAGAARARRALPPVGRSPSSRRCRSRCSAILSPLACYLLAGDVRDAHCCSSSTPARSTRRWPTCCRPSCAAAASRINTMAIHLLGDAPSPLLIGIASDRIGPARAGAGDGRCWWSSPGWCCWRGARRWPRSARGGGARVSATSPASWRSRRASRARRRCWCAATTASKLRRREQGRRRAGHRGRPRRQRADRRAPARRRSPTTSSCPRRCPTRASAWASRASGWSIRSTAPATSSGRHRLRGDDRPLRRRAPGGRRGRPPAVASRSTRGAVGAGAWREDASGDAHAAAHVDAVAARPTSGWSRRSRTARRASTPSSARCRSPTR